MNKIKSTVQNFLVNLEDDNPHRYRSWEICHNIFYNYRHKDLKVEDMDFLAVHLGFYLASWGMYRGSSFLLQDYDYTIHIETVKIAMEFDELFDIDPFKDKERYSELLFGKSGIYNRLSEYYTKLRNDVKNVNSPVSGTLITKILMGVFGCIPAYDRFFIDGISIFKIPTTKNGRPNIECLMEYISKNDMLSSFNKLLQELNNKNKNYTIMKIIDMYFWQLGKEKETTNINK